MTFWSLLGNDITGENEWLTEEGRLRMIGKGNETFLVTMNETVTP